MTASVLDGIAGLGPVRRDRLVKEVGGVRSLRALARDDLRALPWLPDQVADSVYDALHDLVRRANFAKGGREWPCMSGARPKGRR